MDDRLFELFCHSYALVAKELLERGIRNVDVAQKVLFMKCEALRNDRIFLDFFPIIFGMELIKSRKGEHSKEEDFD